MTFYILHRHSREAFIPASSSLNNTLVLSDTLCGSRRALQRPCLHAMQSRRLAVSGSHLPGDIDLTPPLHGHGDPKQLVFPQALLWESILDETKTGFRASNPKTCHEGSSTLEEYPYVRKALAKIHKLLALLTRAFHLAAHS